MYEACTKNVFQINAGTAVYKNVQKFTWVKALVKYVDAAWTQGTHAVGICDSVQQGLTYEFSGYSIVGQTKNTRGCKKLMVATQESECH